MTEIEKLKAENVELSRAVRLLGKFSRHQFNVINGEAELDKKLMMRANEEGAKALSSPSAKWLEAVEKVINQARDMLKVYKNTTGFITLECLIFELDALERESS